jgi:hypothetical protein
VQNADTQSPTKTQVGYQPGKGGKTLFASAGVCLAGTAWTARMVATTISDFSAFVGRTAPLTLGDIVVQTADVPPAFFLSDERLPRWQYLKGAKSVPRVHADGHAYPYKEGAMAFPDSLDKPSRTVITSEGGVAASRTKHVVRGTDGRLRRLTPDELDDLNGFPRGFSQLDGVSDTKRAFLMGNALVTGIVARIGASLAEAMPFAAYATPTPTTEHEAAIEFSASQSGNAIAVFEVTADSSASGFSQVRLQPHPCLLPLSSCEACRRSDSSRGAMRSSAG